MPAPDRAAAAATLDRLRAEIEAAENAGDADAIAALLADDAVVMVPTFDVQEGREACAAFLRDVLPQQLAYFDRRIAYVSAEVSVNGSWAFDRGTFSFTATPRGGGETTRATGKYLWLYAGTSGGAWMLARAIVSLDEPDEEDDHAREGAPDAAGEC